MSGQGFTSLFRSKSQRKAAGILKGRMAKEKPEPFGRVPSRAMFGLPLKTVDADTRAMIDAALARRTSP